MDGEGPFVKALEKLRGRPGVLLDTMVFIYLFEDVPAYAPVCENLLSRMTTGWFGGIATPITLAELIVKPLQQGRGDVADRYRNAVSGLRNLAIEPLGPDAGYIAGALRAKYRLPLPDLLQCAAALGHPRPAVVTNDRELRKVEEVEVFLLEDMRREG
jgi:predicted nucleic acid-binding protein